MFVDSVEDGIRKFVDDDVMEDFKLVFDARKAVDEVKNLSHRNGQHGEERSMDWRKPPYGFRLNKETGKLVIVPEEAAIVAEIFTLFASGEWTVRAIARLLSQRGVRVPRGNGTDWFESTVDDILRNAAYVGDSVFNRAAVGKYHSLADGAAVPRKDKRPARNPEREWIRVPNAHQAIVDRAIFNRVHRLLAERGDAARKRRPDRSPNSEAFILSGLLKCGCYKHAMCGKTVFPRTYFKCAGCGASRTVSLKPGKAEETCSCGAVKKIPEGEGEPWYVCTGGYLQGRTVCRCRLVPETDLLHAIGADLEDMIGEPAQWRDEVISALRAAAQTDPAKLAQRRAALASVEGKLKDAMERFLTLPPSLAGEGTATLEALKAEKTRLESEVRELSEAIEGTADIEAVADEVMSHLLILRLHLVCGERSKVRAVLQRFVDRIIIDFDRDAPRASIVLGYRVRYKPDAFTIRSLLPCLRNFPQGEPASSISSTAGLPP